MNKAKERVAYEKEMVTGTCISFLSGGFQIDGSRTNPLGLDPDQTVYHVCDPENILFPPLPESV
jgi:hypothetical protein